MSCYSPTPARREHETDCDGPRPINIEALIDHVRESPNSVAMAIREWFAGNETAPSPTDQPAAPVELPVVGWLSGNEYRFTFSKPNSDPRAEPLVKLSDAQAAIAAGRKAS